PKLLASGRTKESPDAEKHAAENEDKKVPFAAHKITDVDQKLGQTGKFGAEILEDLSKNWHDFYEQKGSYRECYADYDDRVSHGRFHLFAQTRARFQKASQPVENLRQETAVFTCLHHAHKKPIKHAWMFCDRFVEAFATLHTGGHVTNNVTQVALPFRIALVVERRHSLDKGNASLDHGRKLPGKKNQVRLLDRPVFLA